MNIKPQFMKLSKVRFNLSRGTRYMKWKVETPEGVAYLDPDKHQLLLSNCQLKNNAKTATRIHEGANKTVCSWISCDEVQILEAGCLSMLNTEDRVHYNPRITPNWVFRGENADGLRIPTIVSSGRNVYAIFSSQ